MLPAADLKLTYKNQKMVLHAVQYEGSILSRYCHVVWHRNSVTRLGYFWKVLWTNILKKWIWLLWKCHYLNKKTALAILSVTLFAYFFFQHPGHAACSSHIIIIRPLINVQESLSKADSCLYKFEHCCFLSTSWKTLIMSFASNCDLTIFQIAL